MKSIITFLTSLSLIASPSLILLNQINKQNIENNSNIMTKDINVDSNFLNSNLFNKSIIPSENLSQYINSSKMNGSFANDDFGLTKDKSNYGLPNVRFGGGLFFDYNGKNKNGDWVSL